MFYASQKPGFSSGKEKAAEENDDEKVFNYHTMNYYEILEVYHNATEKDMKRSYLRMAKKYHPDVYKGINKDHFKKINEAYNTLKDPRKREDYNTHQKIKNYKSHNTNEYYEQKMREGNFSKEDYEEMKKNQKVSRDYQDPEFAEELKKYNFDKLFRDFLRRPMRSNPKEMEIMQPILKSQLSRKERARAEFVRNHRITMLNKTNVKLRVMNELQRVERIVDGNPDVTNLTYEQVVNMINKESETKRLMQKFVKPIILYKEAQQAAEIQEKQRVENIKKIKKVSYTFWIILLFINMVTLFILQRQETWHVRTDLDILLRERLKDYVYK